MRYHVTACMTQISALLGFLYSLRGVRNCKGGNDKAFSYMDARSFALLILAVIPMAERSVSALVLITFSMMIVQVIDSVIGITEKSLARTLGPFIMALCHLVCLLSFLLSPDSCLLQ